MSGGASDGPGTFARRGIERINFALPLLVRIGVAFGVERTMRPGTPNEKQAALEAAQITQSGRLHQHAKRIRREDLFTVRRRKNATLELNE